MSANFETGEFYDHENKTGGGVIDLIQHRLKCDRGAAIAWLRNQGLMAGFTSVDTRQSTKPAKVAMSVVCVYDYVDEQGALLHQTVRYEPKTFRQRRPDPANANNWIWNLDGIGTVLYRLPEILTALKNGDVVHVTEGEKDADTLRALGFTATTNPMGAGKWCDSYSELLRNGDVVVHADNDTSGRDHVQKVAASLHGIAARVRVLDIGAVWPECREKGDISDWIRTFGTADKLKEIVYALPDWEPAKAGEPASVADDGEWPEPKPLPSGLAPVEQFSSDFLPASLSPWVDDIANRLQCPPDYLAVGSMVSLGSIMGRRIGIKPQAKTDWVETANLWGAFIGRPGMLKSPAMGEALKPLHYLEVEAVKKNEAALQAYEAELDAFKFRQQVEQSLEKEALKKDPKNKPDSGIDLGDEPKMPPNIRYRTNDSTYQSLGELLINNPTGISGRARRAGLVAETS